MRYPIAIEPRTSSTAYGVVVPDLPGCFSAGDTLEEALAAVEEAAAAWIDAALDAGEAVPPPSSLDALRDNPDYRDWAFGVVTVSPSLLDDSIERVNISLPRRVVKRLDSQARATGLTRSGLIAELSLLSRRRCARRERATPR